MLFGACYYPEHWPEKRWEKDFDLMQKADFNVVRMAEFAWYKMQPNQDVFDFEWLDKAISMLGERGIKTVLGTPSSAPPKWLVDSCNEIYMEDNKGHKRGFGSRRYYCYNSSQYKVFIEILIKKMAIHYKDNENVIGWQIDNELGCGDTTRCYCDNCRTEFIEWLKARYTTIENLNKQWGTIFSSQCYNSWDEVILPIYTALEHHNPSLMLDFYRFSSDSVVKFSNHQKDIIKHIAPHQKVFTNFMGKFGDINYFDLAKELDLVSFDIYQNMVIKREAQPQSAAFLNDITRGLKGKKYWITEHQSGTPGAFILYENPRPGDLRRWTYQSIAHGADAIMYFRWRTITFSVEEYWHGILNHDGLVNRRYEEVKKTGAELKKIANYIDKSQIVSDVAIIRSYDMDWVFELQPHIEGYKYIDHVEMYYRYFYDSNINVDIISPDTDLSQYKLVIAPNLSMSEISTKNKIYEYVNSGGHIVMDFRAGAKKMNNSMTELKLPGKFSKLLGLTINDYGSLNDEDNIIIKTLSPKHKYKASTWYDVIDNETAQVIASFDSDYFADLPAITKNKYGNGLAYYFATVPDKKLLYSVFNDIVAQCNIETINTQKNGIEMIKRKIDDEIIIFAINHNREKTSINLDAEYTNLLDEKKYSGIYEMENNEVMILKR